MPGERVFVPVSSSPTLRQTVDYAVDRALDDASPEAPGLVRFGYVHSPESSQGRDFLGEGLGAAAAAEHEAEELLDRVTVWAEEDAGDDVDVLRIETVQLGADEYLFGPDDVARVVLEDALDADARTVVVDPGYDPGVGAPFLQPLETVLARDERIDVEEAPVTRRVRRAPLVTRATPIQLGALFGLSFLFYQLLAGRLYAFDLVTGAVSATVVTVGLARVTFHRDFDARSPLRVLRSLAFVPYLLWEIVKANVTVAAVILHPRLPIDPRLTRVSSAVWGGLPVTTLANSITLTPGTLTVRVDGRTLVVHTLVPSAREDLFDGGLERAVRFVFYGRRAARIDSPRDRGDAELLQPVPADGTENGVATDGGLERDPEPRLDGEQERDPEHECGVTREPRARRTRAAGSQSARGGDQP